MRHANGNQPAGQPRDCTDLRLRATIGERDEFTFRTIDGVTSPGSFRPSDLRLLDVLTEDSSGTLLVPDANYGVVGIVMADFTEKVWMTETSARAACLCRHNAELNRVDDQISVAITADLRALPETFDAAALAPTEYVPAKVVEQRLADAVATLDPGRYCYLAAAPSTGLTRYERALRDLCEDVTPMDDRAEVTVLRGTRPSHFHPPRYAEPRTLAATIKGTELSLLTYPGLFSATKLDAGTRALAESLAVDDGEHVLDLACGYGPLGIYAALTADCRVSLTDDDCVATNCARKSAKLSGVSDAVEVVTGDGVAGVRGTPFDRVVCNPPTHAGSSALHDLMRGASNVLTGDASLNLVHHQGVSYDPYLDPYFDGHSAIIRGDYRLVTAWP